MDVNGTRFHLLFGARDWAHYADDNDDLYWDPVGANLTLHPLVFRFPSVPGAEGLSTDDRRGVGRDGYGNFFWISEDREELRVRCPDGEPRRYWRNTDFETPPKRLGDFRPVIAPPPPQYPTLHGVAITTDQYLVVGIQNPDGLMIFDLHGGGAPVRQLWPVAFKPFDLCPMPDGGVVVLDRENSRYWRLDRYFRIWRPDGNPLKQNSGDFRNLDGSPEPGLAPGHQPITPQMAFALESDQLIAVECLPDSSLLFLESDAVLGYSRLFHYNCSQLLEPALSLQNALKDVLEDDGASDILGHELALLPSEGTRGTLYIAGIDGKQSFAFALDWADPASLSFELLFQYLPMRNYGGKALLAAAGEVWYDLGENWYSLTAMPRDLYVTNASFATVVLDGKEPNCVWHRLIIDGMIPRGASVIVETRCDNQLDDDDSLDHLGDDAWYREPAPYLRHGGSELPWHRPFTATEAAVEGRGSWELLFQRSRGRYLQLRLTLTGNGRNTPKLRALRAWYPRFSYLEKYLPAIYREDPASASFLDRFLANIEGMFTFLEERIASAQALFDPDATHPEYLEWLAGWLGAELDPYWDERRRRLFLHFAMALYRERGTSRGLHRMIRLALDPCVDESLFLEAPEKGGCRGGGIRIVESWLTRNTPSIVFPDSDDTSPLGVVTTAEAWQPTHGPEALHIQFRAYLDQRYRGDSEAIALVWATAAAQLEFPPLPPEDEHQLLDWRGFLRSRLGFPYAEVGEDDHETYQDFLEELHGTVEDLNQAYGLSYSGWESFADIHPPVELPSGRALSDWIRFVSLYLPMARGAHRFTVLIPITPEMADADDRIDIVRRIVAREKPAHTRFEVKPYWDLFRVGEARLGLDTLLGPGNRFLATVLGRSRLATSFLDSHPPWSLRDRFIADRDLPGSNL